MHRPVLTSAPAVNAVASEDACAHLRVDISTEDALIRALVQAATAHLDGYSGVLGRCLVSQTWLQKFDAWGSILRLPFPDVSSVTVTYTDTSDATQTVSSALYDIFEDERGGYVRFNDDFTAPSIGPDVGGISVSITAGYGATADDVPMPLRHAILLHTAMLYENREAVGPAMQELPLAHGALIAPYRRIGL